MDDSRDDCGGIPAGAARRTTPPPTVRADHALEEHPHPAIYWIIVGLAGWLILSVWGFLGSGYAGLALAVVTIFIAIAVTIPLLLWLIARRHPRRRPGPAESGSPAGSLTQWLAHDFDADTGRTKATVAAIEILLPIAAVAFGMTVFALVRYFDGVV